MNMRHIGDKGEDIACEYLENLGYKIIQRNYTIRGGEIDIIASREGLIYFIEVKYRTSEKHGHPLELMTESKMEAFERAMLSYCEENNLSDETIRRLFVGIVE